MDLFMGKELLYLKDVSTL